MKIRPLLLWLGLMIVVSGTATWLLSTSKSASAQASSEGTTLLVSVSSDGSQSNNWSDGAYLSPNGRYVAFGSFATNLVNGDTNNKYDVFVHDIEAHKTTRISVASDGAQGNEMSGFASFSLNGRYVAFWSEASNLVLNDTNESGDAFIHDQRTGETIRVSVASGGIQANGGSNTPSISADGRFVAFSSLATNLTPDAISGTMDVFVHDRQTGSTTLMSRTSDGSPPNGYSDRPAISADGRYVAFLSEANNLVEGDDNRERDVFVHDRQTGETTLVSVASDGTQAHDEIAPPTISADGRYVVFATRAANLVSGDSNDFCPVDGDHSNCQDVFVHDRQTGQTERVSVTSDGSQSNGSSGVAHTTSAISADGRYVAFWSRANNLVPSDTNNAADIFVHDRQSGQTERVSIAADGSQSNAELLAPSLDMSHDGRVVAFATDATNLVPEDTTELQDIYVRIRGEVPSAVGIISPFGIDPVWWTAT